MTAKDHVTLITGATEGIGKVAARELAALGGEVVLVGRNPEKTKRVAAEVANSSGNGRVRFYVADLSTLAGIKQVVASFKQDFRRLDLLVNNAGALFQDYKLTADGFEQTFALNHLSYFGVTTGLLDLLRSTAGSRVVSTSSGAHRRGKIDLADIARRERRRTAAFGAYCDSKLANILFTKALARRLGPDHPANCYHPGFVRTGFAKNNAGLLPLLFVAQLVARTPEKGAETLLWLATSAEAGSITGEYFHDKRVAATASLARDSDLAERLWVFSENIFRAS